MGWFQIIVKEVILVEQVRFIGTIKIIYLCYNKLGI